MNADAIVVGIEERRRIVVAPRWVRPVVAAKTVLQRLTEKRAEPLMPEIDALTAQEARERGAEAFRPTGAGGRAFMDADGVR